MPRIAVVNIGAHGHINPTLAVCKSLQESGADVSYFAPEEFRLPLEAAGAHLEPFASLMSAPQPPPPGVHPLAMLAEKLQDEFSSVLPQVLPRLAAIKPDLIIYDRFALAAWVAAKELGCRAALFCPSYVMNERFGLAALFRATSPDAPTARVQPPILKLQAGGQTYGELSIIEVFEGREDLNVVFLPRAFQPAGETFGPAFEFVGPCLRERPAAESFPVSEAFLKERPLLFISLGTVFNQWAQFFDLCIEAFADSEWNVVMACGQQVKPADLRRPPDHIKIFSHVPQLEILQHARAFISHGGMNSTMESLYHGVPLIVIPQMPEQAMTAQRVHELRLGYYLPREKVNIESLRQSLDFVMHDADLKKNLQAMQTSLKASGGAAQASTAILKYQMGFK